MHDGQEASEHQREREMVMAVCSSVTGSLRNRENLALNSYLFLGDLKLFPGFIRTKGFFAFIVIVYFKWKSIFIFCFSGSFPNKRKLLGQAF